MPAHNTPIKPSRREALLIAIAKARSWVDELANGRVGSFAMLARREGKVERHIRLLHAARLPSPRIVAGHPRRDGAGRSHHHVARSRVALFLGRAGAAPWSTCDDVPAAAACSTSPWTEGACAEQRLTLIGSLLSPASAARPPRGFGGGGVLLRRPHDGEEGTCGWITCLRLWHFAMSRPPDLASTTAS